MAKNRLSKILARAGVASRRKCEDLIFAGRISVNGTIIKEPQFQVDLKKDHVCFDEKHISDFEKKVYYILNKPKGYVCSHDKERHKNLIVDLFPTKERLFTVGRLDKDTTGLLIVTNDGRLSYKVSHPKFEIEKEYLVKTDREITANDLKRIASGMTIEGTFVKPLAVSKVRKGTVKITVKEGKKHEVRLLIAQTGSEVVELTRIRIGNLRLGNQLLGSYKAISLEEIELSISQK
ncbi:MAG: Ribosomal small subunit pseudouridine synthase A [Chlamydiae bacterium]|nr:Ribosomal small subunit pseudouridine synthase A [Chlamydiota bacterium]